MQKWFRRLAVGMAAVLFVVVGVAGFLAYFVKSWSPDHTRLLDGVGRSLEPAPWLARFYLGTDGVWAGLGWHIAVLALFFGGWFGAAVIGKWGLRWNESAAPADAQVR